MSDKDANGRTSGALSGRLKNEMVRARFRNRRAIDGAWEPTPVELEMLKAETASS